MAPTDHDVADNRGLVLGDERELRYEGSARAQSVDDPRLDFPAEGGGLDPPNRVLVGGALGSDHAAAARGASAARSSRKRGDSSSSRRGPPSTTPSSAKIARASSSRAASGFCHSAASQARSSR